MIKRSSALKADCRWTSISIGTEAVPRRLYKTFVQVIGRGRWGVPSMRNLLDKSSVAQSLDGDRLTGSLRTPAAKLVPDSKDRKRRLPQAKLAGRTHGRPCRHGTNRGNSVQLSNSSSRRGSIRPGIDREAAKSAYRAPMCR